MNKKIMKYIILRTISNFLILLCVFGVVATFGPALYYEASYQVGKARGITYQLAPEVQNSNESELGKLLKKYKQEGEPQEQSPSLLGDITSNNKEKILIPPDSAFSIVIPKIGASERIEPNVDASNKEEYLKVLQHSIAHAKGTAYPGIDGTTYLFAHSADNFWNVGRYNAVFYLLKDLEPGDEIYTFFNGKKHTYEVYDKKTVDSGDTQYIDPALGQGERLILQTCWPPGTDWKRTLVFAKPKSL